MQPLTPSQITAFRKAQALGRILAEEHPEITADYESGCTHFQIAKKYTPQEIRRSRKVATSAVGYALRELLPEEECQVIARDHKLRGSRAVGRDTLRKKKGIHAQTLEERVELGRKNYDVGLGQLDPALRSYFGRMGGKAAAKVHARQRTGFYAITPQERTRLGRQNGTKVYQNGTGIYAMTAKEKRQALIKSLEAQGKVPYNKREIATLERLAQNPEYQHPNGDRQPGRPDYARIQVELNRRFGNERTISSLRTRYCRL